MPQLSETLAHAACLQLSEQSSLVTYRRVQSVSLVDCKRTENLAGDQADWIGGRPIGRREVYRWWNMGDQKRIKLNLDRPAARKGFSIIRSISCEEANDVLTRLGTTAGLIDLMRLKKHVLRESTHQSDCRAALNADDTVRLIDATLQANYGSTENPGLDIPPDPSR